ncbi:MAG: RNA methyltransferase [Oscillospiraceae bacterium]|nr:RNA methyltransferase [Oscillospiraceae bacterium]
MKITSRKNERVQHLKRLGADASYRAMCGEMLCDGGKLLEEAIAAGIEIREIFTSGALDRIVPAGAVVYETDREIIESISTQKTPQSVVFSAKTPEFGELESLDGAIILENIQDPGNVGSVIRTANAFGVRQVVLVGDCADPYSPKTIRATMGAAFKKPVYKTSLDELAMIKGKTPVYAAALSDSAADVRKIDLRSCAVAVGNEGRGLTREMISFCDGTIIIPMTPYCESLNASVAAAILMWEMTKDNL